MAAIFTSLEHIQVFISSLFWLPVAVRGILIGGFEFLFALVETVSGTRPSRAEFDRFVQAARERDARNPKVAIVTGSNTGIGLETAKALALAGYHVFIACRSREKGEKAVAETFAASGNDKIYFMPLDLQDLTSVRKFVDAFLARGLPLHLLINNAGVMDIPFALDNKGLELQFSTNHIGHYLLTRLLLDKLKESAPSRIVNLSSCAHYGAEKIDRDALTSKEKYSSIGNYCISKLANVLFTISLAKRLAGTGVTANAVHPGVIPTLLYNAKPHMQLGIRMLQPILPTVKDGAYNTLLAALDPVYGDQTGKFIAHQAVRNPSVGVSMEEAERLWEYSAGIVGLEV
ncbi:Retinol dehydrogenase 12 [Borealophlyctis nickersoniae]|nr:Retinol dehydrogenase 12 [Borealophlyctis nickersoniae]